MLCVCRVSVSSIPSTSKNKNVSQLRPKMKEECSHTPSRLGQDEGGKGLVRVSQGGADRGSHGAILETWKMLMAFQGFQSMDRNPSQQAHRLKEGSCMPVILALGEMEARGSETESHPQLYSDFLASLSYCDTLCTSNKTRPKPTNQLHLGSGVIICEHSSSDFLTCSFLCPVAPAWPALECCGAMKKHFPRGGWEGPENCQSVPKHSTHQF